MVGPTGAESAANSPGRSRRAIPAPVGPLPASVLRRGALPRDPMHEAAEAVLSTTSATPGVHHTVVTVVRRTVGRRTVGHRSADLTTGGGDGDGALAAGSGEKYSPPALFAESIRASIHSRLSEGVRLPANR